MSFQWAWDPVRQDRYYWNPAGNFFFYETYGQIFPNQGYNVQGLVQAGPVEQITEPQALQSGIRAHKKVRETPGDAETLDPRYKKHYPGYTFYKTGKVFKVLWPEPAGNPQSGQTFITGNFGESIYAKFRWFVVIREGQDCCTCLPIQTYNRQGVRKQGVIKGEHSIVYTGTEPPQIPEWEDPIGEMLEAIPVIPKNPAERKMDPMSRLNYAKPYTVEHNVKSLDFGDVPPEWISSLRSNFALTLQLPQTVHAADASQPPASQSAFPLSPGIDYPNTYPNSSSSMSADEHQVNYGDDTQAGAEQGGQEGDGYWASDGKLYQCDTGQSEY